MLIHDAWVDDIDLPASGSCSPVPQPLVMVTHPGWETKCHLMDLLCLHAEILCCPAHWCCSLRYHTHHHAHPYHASVTAEGEKKHSKNNSEIFYLI